MFRYSIRQRERDVIMIRSSEMLCSNSYLHCIYSVARKNVVSVALHMFSDFCRQTKCQSVTRCGCKVVQHPTALSCV